MSYRNTIKWLKRGGERKMKVVQNMTTKTSLMSAKAHSETLPNGNSVSRAVLMSGKGCCGASFVDKA
jgi:hypothetical protein